MRDNGRRAGPRRRASRSASGRALAGTAFTYQGQLTNGGSPVNGPCDFQFDVYDSAVLGLQFGSTQTVTGVAVADGRFTVTLNSAAQFGARTFSGSARYLAIAVRCPAGSGPYTSLTPRQALTAVPLAFALPGLYTVQNSYSPNVIGGYAGNTVGLGWFGATISGGGAPDAPNSVTYDLGTVVGGLGNTASDAGATVAGGGYNTAGGAWSFAAGYNARALHDGAFVWSSEVNVPISSTVDNQFLVRATGGISLTTNTAGTTGCRLSAGGGTWTCTSDRNAKANFAAVDNVAVLNALMSIPIQTWNFNTQDAGIQHMGPMAQDFYAAYGLGEGELTISAVDADGVALAAIQGLYTVVQEKEAAITALEARVVALEKNGPLTPAAPLSAALPWLLLAGVVLLNVGGLAGYALAKRGGKRA